MNTEERERYSRQIRLKNFGETRQQKLKNSSVLIVGMGGLGCPIAQYLAASGVGRMGLMDFDTVQLSNLQRQVLFTTAEIGQNKAQVAKSKLQALNDSITLNAIPEKLTTQNALSLFNQYDVVVDATDDLATRYLINDACRMANKPFVYGGIHQFEGQVSVFNYNNGPSYRCLFPAMNTAHTGTCEENGVLGVLPGMIGSIQASETLKILTGLGTPLSGKLMLFDALSTQQSIFTITRSQWADHKMTVEEFEQTNYPQLCSNNTVSDHHITPEELQNWVQAEKEFLIIDVRAQTETPRLKLPNQIALPLAQLITEKTALNHSIPTVLICQSGNRSLKALQHLQKMGYTNMYNLTGGVKAIVASNSTPAQWTTP